MTKHECNYSLPRVHKLNGSYIICDPDLLELSDDVEITVIGLNATWKIKAKND